MRDAYCLYENTDTGGLTDVAKTEKAQVTDWVFDSKTSAKQPKISQKDHCWEFRNRSDATVENQYWKSVFSRCPVARGRTTLQFDALQPTAIGGPYDAGDTLINSPRDLIGGNPNIQVLFYRAVINFAFVRTAKDITRQRSRELDDRPFFVVKRKKKKRAYADVPLMPLPPPLSPRVSGGPTAAFADLDFPAVRVQWDKSNEEFDLSMPPEWYESWIASLPKKDQPKERKAKPSEQDYANFVQSVWERIRENDLAEARQALQDAKPPITGIEDLERIKSDSEELGMLVRFLIEANVFGTYSANEGGDMSRLLSPVLQKQSRGSTRRG
jgi:hypothetical protein